ncbi:Lipoamide acyltransferase component of branched-chain alpha-keto acid dehydrogenase complex [Bacillus sp. THAF10]|uniref:dihydrolipoamide acetyltransferase family protein n=1 Tax=Bacillus sp. THAF10 TaxID=2587848 RepID=UPI0012AAA1BB|nr:dihydrolipoamide acetyltransferase family protein [Bacillus sp. THAF10]QFT89204.1 Lipoamide acyltransferase component of branched-chain alpha-keto acid dehydrogenase complex [Bacillus sp. THAF10]
MIEVKLHDIGEGMTQADVLTFFVKSGDSVKPDQPLVEVQTDKMTAEIPAPAAGVIKEIKVEVGQTIPVGTTIFLMESDGSSNKAEDEKVIETTNLSASKPTASTKTFRIMAAPYTRKIAREAGVNIEEVKGTGPGGRITDEDVFRFISNEEKSPEVTEKEKSVPQKSASSTTTLPKETSQTIPFRGRRKQIAHKMAQSLRTIPHCTHFEEVDATNILEMRAAWKNNQATISATAFFLKAISVALKDYPIFNARLNEAEETIELIREHHIGIATDTEEGLIVPVVKNVEAKSLREIHASLKDLTGRAQENKLSMQDISGGSFTISNVGPLGGSIGATPIINHPEVALISFHKTKKRPVVNDQDEIVIRSMMNISMSFDHRVADGATAVAFTNRLSQLLEQPNLLMMELV